MECALKNGYYLAGFLSYEAGYAFEECLREDKQHDFPLICMGVYNTPECLSIQPSVGVLVTPLF